MIVPSKFGQRFAAGHVVEGDRHMFVATGLGTSILPVRFRVPPTVTILTLAPEPRLRALIGERDARGAVRRHIEFLCQWRFSVAR